MPLNNLVRVTTAGGFTNPALNLAFTPDLSAAHQNAIATQRGRMQNRLMGYQLAEYPEERNYLLQQRQQAAADKAYEVGRRPVRDTAEGLQNLRAIAPGFTLNSYLQNRDNLKGFTGLDDTFLPTLEDIEANAAEYGQTPEQSFEELKRAWLGQAPPEVPKEKWSTPKEGTDEQGNPVVYRVGPDGQVDILKGVKPKQKGQMRVYDSKGNLIFESGATDTGLQKPTTKRIETKIVDANEQLTRIMAIYDAYKPEYLELGERFDYAWSGLKSKLGKPVEEKDRKKLVEFKKFQRRAIENINQYIKELTGAQMSQAEADRLKLAQPDPGQKWWQGDSPIVFEAKMNDVIIATRAAVARWNYYKSKNIDEATIIAMIDEGRAKKLDDIIAEMK